MRVALTSQSQNGRGVRFSRVAVRTKLSRRGRQASNVCTGGAVDSDWVLAVFIAVVDSCAANLSRFLGSNRTSTLGITFERDRRALRADRKERGKDRHEGKGRRQPFMCPCATCNAMLQGVRARSSATPSLVPASPPAGPALSASCFLAPVVVLRPHPVTRTFWLADGWLAGRTLVPRTGVPLQYFRGYIAR